MTMYAYRYPYFYCKNSNINMLMGSVKYFSQNGLQALI